MIFFSFSYWFNLRPGFLDPSVQKFLVILFGFVFIIGIAGNVLASNKVDVKSLSKIYKKIGRMGLTMGFLGFCMLFFFFQEIYLFSARFWFIVWTIGLVFWLCVIIYFAKVKKQKLMQRLKEQEEFEKYLPKKKN